MMYLGTVLRFIEPDCLLCLEEPGATGHAHRFQGWTDGKANGFVRPSFVRDEEIGGQGIQTTLDALHARIV